MFTVTSLWIPFTVVAALGQVARNAMQRSLTKPLGTWGATNIRFLFGFPFSLLFLGAVLVTTGDHLGMPPAVYTLPASSMLYECSTVKSVASAPNNRSVAFT